MPRPRFHGLTYANAVSTIALFVALGGTSYAALSLPRNSVGPAQIRHGAVRSSEIHDGQVGLRDLRQDAVDYLRYPGPATGQTGAPGERGLTGPAGAPATTMVAAVDGSTGDLLHGSSVYSVSKGPLAGTYYVALDRDALPIGASGKDCIYLATLGLNGDHGTFVGPGSVTVEPSATTGFYVEVQVRTYNGAGDPADQAFQVAAFCPTS
jgi:hypothetical protein